MLEELEPPADESPPPAITDIGAVVMLMGLLVLALLLVAWTTGPHG